jgi:hypothetical protein
MRVLNEWTTSPLSVRFESVLALRMLRALSLGYRIDPDRCLLIDK